LQCYGTKYWLFWKPSDLKKNGIHLTAASAGEILSGSPQSIVKIPTVHAAMHANDLMAFPLMAVHVTASKRGKNIMMAFRRLDLTTIWSAVKQDPANTFWTFTRNAYQAIFEKVSGTMRENSYFYERRISYPFHKE